MCERLTAPGRFVILAGNKRRRHRSHEADSKALGIAQDFLVQVITLNFRVELGEKGGVEKMRE